MTRRSCDCGEITGERCSWDGRIGRLVQVEYVPRYLQGTARAARSWTCLSSIIRCERECADALLAPDEDGEADPWIRLATSAPRRRRERQAERDLQVLASLASIQRAR